ncbi:MAG: oxidoreductase [Proteobacteria bacterium]|nr:oxidoreductase [Pseudomonadota bacterium]MBI3498653.1 oxidoreductase [Pseudomonadota bacterium]
MTDSFRALLLREAGGKVSAALETLKASDLPDGDVTVRVRYSTLNYKDGMILKGLGRLVRSYPHVPGVDFSGTVEDSSHPGFEPGEEVVLTGWRVGEQRWGGYAGLARVKGEWLVKLPSGLSLKQAMAIGTAGFTSGMAVAALEAHGLTPEKGEVLVTGAAGGVGSVAVALLARGGYRVAASTGRPETSAYLKDLGASQIIDRASLAASPGRPLLSERWAGAVDSVGGSTLAHILAEMKTRAAAASCGLAGGAELNTTVIPFLLRGVSLIGIDSVLCPMEERQRVWQRLARDLPKDTLDAITDTAKLEDLPRLADDILAGHIRGRMVVEIE